MTRLVGSEMCIRDSVDVVFECGDSCGNWQLFCVEF
jgi:hypothetical protein